MPIKKLSARKTSVEMLGAKRSIRSSGKNIVLSQTIIHENKD